MTSDLQELQRHLREFENQFDNAQGNLRAAGSLWTLAGIGGLGGVLALTPSAALGVGLSQPTLISFVCFLVIIGLCNLWSLDQFVYQRLLHAVFSFGMNLEDYLAPTERVRQSINNLVPDVSGRLSRFYFIPILIYGGIFFASNLICIFNPATPTVLAVLLWLLFFVCFFQTLLHFRDAATDTVSDYKDKIAKKISEMRAAKPLPKDGAQ